MGRGASTDRYDKIGASYSSTRRPDPRIAARIVETLSDAASVVNIGAGTGSYEPSDRKVIAVEPSTTMIAQRPRGSAPVLQATAEALPLVDGAVDAALAVLTVHHWADTERGFAEMRRVARRRVVIFTWDQGEWEPFWLINEYFPAIRDLDRPRAVTLDGVLSALGGGEVIPVLVPHDCIDGFHGAFWRRPEAYLDPKVRAGISTYALMQPHELEDGLRRLAADIDSGAWARRHCDLLDLDELDLGYRLVVAETSEGPGTARAVRRAQ